MSEKEKMVVTRIFSFFKGHLHQEHQTSLFSDKVFNPLPDDKFYSSKLKEFAEDNFKFDENG